jgi:hypothetical protein
MHANTILTHVLGSCLTNLHAKRTSALLRATTALLHGNITSLTAFPLCLSGSTKLKHRIKSVDQLLGNSGLHLARGALYQNVAQRWQLLRASVVVEGRSVTLYEEVHPQKLLGNANVHRCFLKRLSGILPAGVRLIVMTDAGFHAPWFKIVMEQGWEFVGRIRGRNRVQWGDEKAWIPARDLYGHAREKTLALGLGAYARSNPVAVRGVLSKRPNKGRNCLNIYGAKRTGTPVLKMRVARVSHGYWQAVWACGIYPQMRLLNCTHNACVSSNHFAIPRTCAWDLDWMSPVRVARNVWKCYCCSVTWHRSYSG